VPEKKTRRGRPPGKKNTGRIRTRVIDANAMQRVNLDDQLQEEICGRRDKRCKTSLEKPDEIPRATKNPNRRKADFEKYSGRTETEKKEGSIKRGRLTQEKKFDSSCRNETKDAKTRAWRERICYHNQKIAFPTVTRQVESYLNPYPNPKWRKRDSLF